MPNPVLCRVQYFLVPALFVLLVLACASSKRSQNHQATDLLTMMKGSFNSSAQAARDSNYYSVDLHMQPIWPGLSSPENAYLYVEQALSEYPDRPYRQRVYRVYKIDETHWASEVYEFANPQRMTGAWRNPERFDSWTPDSLQLREGCTVWLEAKKDGYAGATQERACESSLRGASFASSEVSIYPDSILSWDRGYDSLGQQVWGAELGGYAFLRQQTAQE